MSARTQHRAERLPAHEELLLDYAERLEKHLPGRRAVHLRLSKLQPHNRKAHHVRVAASSFDHMVQAHEGQCYTMSNRDIVVVVRDVSVAQIDDIILKLRYLFSDDPLVAQEDSTDGEAQGFVTWFDLEKDYPRFLATTRKLYNAARQGGSEGEGEGEGEADVAAKPAKAKKQKKKEEEAPDAAAPMTAERLHLIEQQLGGADISGWIRRQPICAILPGQPAKAVFNEVFVSMDELRRQVMPDVNLFSNRWLFQHMTEVVDQRLLRQLPELEAEIKLSTSLNLNVSSLLSEQFLVFDRELRSRTKKSMVAELQPIDVFGDIGSYQFARDFIRERNFKICLDGLNYLTFPLLARGDLDLDFLKIVWAPDLTEDGGSKRSKAFAEAVQYAGATRVILCRCDTMDAVRHGQAMGITLFQGRLIDQLAASGESV